MDDQGNLWQAKGGVCQCCGQKLPVEKEPLTRSQVQDAVRRCLDQFPPYASGNTASYLSALGIAEHAPSMRISVLLYLVSCYPEGRTDWTGSEALSMYRYTYAPRRNELAGVGLVMERGTVESQNPQQTGGSETQWAATPAAVEFVNTLMRGGTSG